MSMGTCTKISITINRKSRVSYPELGFLSSATWNIKAENVSLLIIQSINQATVPPVAWVFVRIS